MHPGIEQNCFKNQRFPNILLISGCRRLRLGTARTAADLVFALAPGIHQGMELGCFKIQRFLDNSLILGWRRLRPGPARTTTEVVFVLASKVTPS